MTQSTRTVALEPFRTACHRGTQWLLALCNSDGSIGPIGQRLAYYRVPWALQLVGETAAAAGCLDWIDRHMIDADGEFRGVTPRALFDQRYGSYPLACLVTGAQLAGRSDLVRRCTPRLLSWQDAVGGGFYGRRCDIDPQGEQELFPTCQGGMSLLAIGHIDEAIRAGTWVERLWHQQPDVDQRLFQITRGTGELVTDFPPAEAALYVTEKSDPWQHHFNGGIAAALLAGLFLATGEEHWLQSAHNYQAFSMTTDACQFRSMQTCKSGWGAGLLWVATGTPVYRDWTYRMGHWFVEHQFEDGHWENTKFWTPQPSREDNLEITAEFVMHLAHILQFLEAREDSP